MTGCRIAKRKTVGRVVVAMAVVLGAWKICAAQGMYYKEIKKDNNIYVFNTPEGADRFEKSGEIPGSISKAGIGPNGETVIAENYRALELYYFKHDISEPVPQPPPRGRISGYAFGDYYYVSEHHPTDPDWEGQHGFWLRRVYFTYDYDLSSKLTTRFRLEMNSPGNLESTTITPYVKDAYIRWTYLNRQQIYLGISPTATFNWIEGFYGLRHIEKTPVDLYRLDSSRDFGVTVEGPVSNSSAYYVGQYGNDSSQRAEIDIFKAYRFEGRFVRNPGIAVEGFYGFYHRAEGKDQAIYQLFGGVQTPNIRAGLHYVRQSIESGTSAPDTRINVTSTWGVFEVIPKKATVFGRVDWVNGNNNMTTGTGVPGMDGVDYLHISDQHDFNFILGGMEWYFHPNFRLGPNVEVVNYGHGPLVNGAPIKNDVFWRITFYWTF